jgi:hypothetical protein
MFFVLCSLFSLRQAQGSLMLLARLSITNYELRFFVLCLDVQLFSVQWIQKLKI